jgi:MvaI/BcnI restriction endonuclease family protein
MNESQSLREFASVAAKLGATRVLFKVLAANDNSKNQIYFGSSFDVIQMLPLGAIESDPEKPDRLKASLALSWIDDEGRTAPAPDAQLILYPQYPEVRFSGFLRGCVVAPSQLLNQRARIPGRILALAIARDRTYASVFPPTSRMAGELRESGLPYVNVFRVLEVAGGRTKLLTRLGEINQKGWIPGRLLRADGTVVAHTSPNAGGTTLEAELGIPANAHARPDFEGWEVKAHISSGSSRLTLMTPEPTGGFYREAGARAFVRRFGRVSAQDPDRVDFSGTFRNKMRQSSGLTLGLAGFDPLSRRFEPTGAVELRTDSGELAASWAFAALLGHWTRKHDQASYVPYEKTTDSTLSFRYGPMVRLGVGTDFTRFLSAMSRGIVIYDPGLNIRAALSGRSVVKVRSQFRTSISALDQLYETFEVVDVRAT